MLIDATSISHFQYCARRAALELRYRPARWRAKTLWERHLRAGIMALSSGADLDETIREEKSRFLGQCANPGLDLPPGANPFIIAKDWAMALEMVLRSAARMTLLTLRSSAPITLSPDHTWSVAAPADDSGVLHRWLACDRWDQDELSRQAHSWWVFGDMAATRRSMMLHVVEIGQVRNGRRDSCWTRGWRHRYAPNLPIKFKRAHNIKADDYVTEYLADQRGDASAWVDALAAEGLINQHIRHVTLECPSDDICADTVRQMISLTDEISKLKADSRDGEVWSALPMSRSACDGMVPCPWQGACYQWPAPRPEEAGYVRIGETPEEQGSSVRKLPPASPRPTQPATRPEARR